MVYNNLNSIQNDNPNLKVIWCGFMEEENEEDNSNHKLIIWALEIIEVI